MQIRSKAWLAALAVSSPAAGTGVSPVSRAEIVYHTVFLDGTARKWEDVPISRPVSNRVLKLVPETAGVYAMIGLDCKQISRSGRLEVCKTEINPELVWLQAVADAAVEDIQIDKSYARSVQGKVRFVNIQLRVSKSLDPATYGPCWPPSCVLEPALLPPPP